MILLLDTCILIDVLRRRRDRADLLKTLTLDDHVLATSAMCVAEVYAGMRPGERAETASVLEELLLFPVTYEIARRAGQVRFDQARTGRTFDLPDLLIAATAFEHNLVVFTDNRKDFPFPGLSFFEDQDFSF